MLRYLVSWPMILAVATLIMAIAMLIEPTFPASPQVNFTEPAELV